MSKLNYKSKIISQNPINQIPNNKKRSTSQIKYQKAPDIMTQAKPAYLNNFIHPINPHQLAFTPTNRSKNLDQNTFLLPKKSSEFLNKKTLILDLDETLVHSSFIPFQNNDIILNVDFESVMYNIYVLVRPGAKEFIKKISKLYEIIIFTASIAKYALPLLDILDEEKNIKYRLTREHCTFLNGIYIKELKKLNRDLKDLIIVDNSPLAYAFDSDNGLPIKGWYDDKEDKELDKIFPILEFLAKTKDVRTYIKKFVINNEIIYDTTNELILNFNKKNKNNHNKINNNNVNNNKKNFNKDNNERKAISVNINLNIKGKNNKKEIKINKISNKENINKNNNIKMNINDVPNNNYIEKLFNDIKNISYNINNTNNNFNNNNLKNGLNLKNKNMNNNKDKITNNKTSVILQKKKNSFRKGPKLGEKLPFKNTLTTNNIHLKNNHNKFFINNTKYPINSNDIDFPFNLSLSKTTKNRISANSQFLYNNKEKNSKQNISKDKEDKNMSYDKNKTLNYNYQNKPYKYTNLLEKLDNKFINNKSQNTNKSSKLFNGKNMLQKKKYNNHNKIKKFNHFRGNSSLIGKYQALILNNSISDNKINSNYHHVSRSKSTGNFVFFSKKFQKPKTPKGQYLFDKKIIVGNMKDINKNNKKGVKITNGFSKTTRHANVK